ncbi:MAG: hypothetical protein FJZ95_02645 [Chloroflexi bacterium]|nr:hypothetical protein [Chloroflexota bacterium]
MAVQVQKDESLGKKAQRVRDSFFASRVPPSPVNTVPMTDCWIRDVFESYIVVESPNGLFKYEYTEAENGPITFGEPQKVEETYVAASASESKIISWLRSGLSLFGVGPEKSAGEYRGVVTKDIDMKICSEDERTVGGLVLVAGEVDSQGDYWRPEDIRKVSLKFMEKYQIVDKMHTFIRVATPVESVYFPTEEEGGQKTYKWYGGDVPAGAWWLTVKVDDDDSWAAVKSGKFTGFSIFGIKKSAPFKQSSKGETVTKAKELRLMEGDDWDVTTVALVNKPAVKQATYYVVKRDSGNYDDLLKAVAKQRSENPSESTQKGGAEMEVTKTNGTQVPNTATKGDEPKPVAVVGNESDAVAKSLAEMTAALKSFGEQLTALSNTVKEIQTTAKGLEVKSEEIDEVSKRAKALEDKLAAITRKSNALPVEAASNGETVEKGDGMPSWANLSGGERRK